MANGNASQTVADEWEYHPAKPAADDEWDYKPASPAPDPAKVGSMGKSTSAASRAGSALLGNGFPYFHPVNALEEATKPIENYTQEGRAEHPFLSKVGDATSALKEYGRMVEPEINLLTLPQAGEGIVNAVRNAPQMLARLKPGLSTVADIVGHPSEIPKKLVNLLPDKPTFPGAPLPSMEDFYENRGADLMRRGRAETALERQAAREAKSNAPQPPLGSPENPDFHSKLPTRMPTKIAPPKSPTPSPFEGMSPTSGPGFQPRTTPFPGFSPSNVAPTPKVSFVDKLTAPEAPVSRIIEPGSAAPHVEGSYWSFKEQALRKAVMGGDRDAAIVYKQRFGQLPEGASFLTDAGSGANRGLYRSRE